MPKGTLRNKASFRSKNSSKSDARHKLIKFRKILNPQVYDIFKGKTIKQLNSEEKRRLRKIIASAMKESELKRTPNSFFIRRILQSQLKRHIKNGTTIPKMDLKQKVKEEIKCEESQIKTRSKTCLPSPGLVPVPIPVDFIQNDKRFPVYKSKDLMFDQLASQMIETQGVVSSHECDKTTPQDEVEYFVELHQEQSNFMLTLLSYAPTFFDVQNEGCLTFTWQNVCKEASENGVPPLNLLVYATIMKAKSLNYSIPDVTINLEFIDYKNISEQYPPMSVPQTCPVFNQLKGFDSLRQQVFFINSIYEKFLMGARLVDSHALFLEFVRKDLESGFDFSKSIITLDPTKIQQMEQQLFDEYNEKFGQFAMAEHFRRRRPGQNEESSFQILSLFADEFLNGANQMLQTQQNSSDSQQASSVDIIGRRRVYLDVVENNSQEQFMRYGRDSDVDFIVEIPERQDSDQSFFESSD